MQQLKDWFFGLQPRERVIVAAGALIVPLVLIYMFALAPFYSAVSLRAQRVATKEGDVAWMRSVAPEIAMLNATSPARAAPTGESLVVLIDRTSRECGLGAALTGQTPNGESSIRVRLEGAEFDKLMVCLGTLQQVHQVNIDSATIDRTGKPGLVYAGLVLSRAGG
jgi:general secretion pathway protein M